MTISEAAHLALQHHQANRLPEAEALYKQILETAPQEAGIWHLYGVLAQQCGRSDCAVEWIGRAISLQPPGGAWQRDYGIALQGLGRQVEAIVAYQNALSYNPQDGEAWNNLGIVLLGQNRVAESIEACRAAMRWRPDLAVAPSNLGNALRAAGDFAGAAEAYRQSLAMDANYAEGYNNLGCILMDTGHFEEAIAAYQRALELQPGQAMTHFNLGKAFTQARRLPEAAASTMRAHELDPGSADICAALADLYLVQGRPNQAVDAYRAAIERRPGTPTYHNDLGNALKDLHRFEESIAAYQEAIRLKPDYALAYSNLSCAFRDTARPQDCIAACRKAIELDGANGVLYNNLACGLKDEGDMDGALAAFREGHRLTPEISQILSNVIYTMHSHLGSDAAAIAVEHRAWNERYAAAQRHHRRPFQRARDARKRLKIGYLSPNFWSQAESYFVIPLLQGHDHERFEIHAYSSARRVDGATALHRAAVDVWHEVPAMPAEELARKIRADGIDILIDLVMHMAESFLPVFAMRPAPVQVSWLAYPGTTGMETMDYWLTDAHMEPPEETPETDVGGGHPYRLPDSWCCYHPVTPTPPVGPLPALRNGYLTFGSLNNFCKVNDAVLAQWAKVLHAVPGSRLLLLCPPGIPRERIQGSLQGLGIALERITFHAHVPRDKYLALYHEIDVGLDPFPYNGITTTNDAVWMGVPVLSVPRRRPASRAGLSLLTTLGLADFAPPTEEALVEKAQALAADLPALAALRARLREQMEKSPMLDHRLFARHMETAYRTMWQRWCEADG